MSQNKKVRSVKKISKDKVRNLDFRDADVLSGKSDQQRRLIELRKAVSPNRVTPRLVRIVFESLDGLMMVETEELRLNEHYVSLKEGCFIPLKSIHATNSLS